MCDNYQEYQEYHEKTIILRKQYDGKLAKKEALRSGNTEIIKKNKNKNNEVVNPNFKKIDESNDAGKHNTISNNIRILIIKGRNNKGWTQKILANSINVKPSVINDYESGKAIPNNQILGKLERKLGIKLRGKNI